MLPLFVAFVEALAAAGIAAAGAEAGEVAPILAADVPPAGHRLSGDGDLVLAPAVSAAVQPPLLAAIGDNVVVGAVGLEALREKVSTSRCGKPSC